MQGSYGASSPTQNTIDSLTRFVKLVIMMPTSMREVEERLARLVGDIDPASPHGRKRRRILEAATDLFIAQGYRRTNIEEIARRAGIGKGTVYLHFATKAEVLLAVTALEKQRALTLVADIIDPRASARERLKRWATAALRMVAHSPLFARILAGDEELTGALADLDPALVAEAHADRDEFLGQLLDEVAHPHAWPADARKERLAVLEALPHFAPTLRSEQIRQGLSVDRFAEVLASLLVDGLRLDL